MADTEEMEEMDTRDSGPLPMKFFSTWEVRKVPPNCVSRSCSLTITRLQLLQAIEPGLQSVVLSVSMKTPHRSLRSNELEVPVNGMMNIALNLTFTLEYPHFLKRGGNDLQIRLQRKKRYRYRTIRGYKTLARGQVNMAWVLQKSFQGIVKLFSEKNSDPQALVTVSTITSTPAEHIHPTDGGSSDEDDEIIFSDELAERGSDSDSIENLDPANYERTTENVPKISLKQPSSVFRLLRLRTSGRQRGVPVQVTLGLDEEAEEEVGSIASSMSDSYDDEDETLGHDQTTPRPRLRPFFGSDTLSIVSTTQQISEPVDNIVRESLEVITNRDKTRSTSPAEILEPLDMPESALIEGRLWLIDSEIQTTLHSLGEPFLATPTQCTSSSLLSLLNTLHNLWHKPEPFLLLVSGTPVLLSTILRAYITGPTFSILIYLWSDIERKARMVSPSSVSQSASADDDKEDITEESIAQFLCNLEEPLVCRPLPIAEAELSFEATPEVNTGTRYVPFIYNIVMGPWDVDTTNIGRPPSSPTTPPVAAVATGAAATNNTSVGNSSPVTEHHELSLEYWNGKKESQKSNIKVRSVMITVIAGPLLNITAIVRKKGIRIRRSKDSTGETSIISNTATYLVLRRSTKSDEPLTAYIDGVKYTGLANIKLSAQWNHTQCNMFPRATCHTPPNSVTTLEQ